MLGALIIAIIITVGIPVGFMLAGAAVSFVFGWTLTDNAVAEHEGSDLIETNY